jgi:hypothetical protein
VTLLGVNFTSMNPFTPQAYDEAVTEAFVPFGTATQLTTSRCLPLPFGCKSGRVRGYAGIL